MLDGVAGAPNHNEGFLGEALCKAIERSTTPSKAIRKAIRRSPRAMNKLPQTYKTKIAKNKILDPMT